MDAHLSKPLAKEVLLATIASIIENGDPRDAPANIAAPSFNRTALLDNLDGDTVLLDRVTTLFKQYTSTYLDQMRSAITRRDGTALDKSAHTLLSSLGVFGAHSARDITVSLQAAGKSQDFEEAEQHLIELENETGRIYAAIASHS
jgi:HPt (histidine-containing phosphotransfer) domain-containing protein